MQVKLKKSILMDGAIISFGTVMEAERIPARLRTDEELYACEGEEDFEEEMVETVDEVDLDDQPGLDEPELEPERRILRARPKPKKRR